MYIPYLYFNVKPANKEIEKSRIEIVTKGQKDLSKFIQSVINKETEFFIIDAKFWNVWGSLCGWSKKEEIPKEAKVRIQKPLIDLTSILEYSGKLKQI